MRIKKFTDFVSNEGLNESFRFINEEDTKTEDVMQYTINKDGLIFDFTDLYTNYINK